MSQDDLSVNVLLMTVIPSHHKATDRQDCLDTWRAKRRISVPTKNDTLDELAGIASAAARPGEPAPAEDRDRTSRFGAPRRPAETPDKRWFYIPAILLLVIVWKSQSSRRDRDKLTPAEA